MSKKKNLNFQSYIGLIYGRDHFLLLCEPLKKSCVKKNYKRIKILLN
jgi:hypothetical protein